MRPDRARHTLAALALPGALLLAEARAQGPLDVFAPARDVPVGEVPSSVALADVDGDGRLDAIVTHLTSATGPRRLWVLLGRGDGTFGGPATYATGSEPVAVAVADGTGDGVADLSVANYAVNTISVLPGRGDGTFAAGSQLSFHPFSRGPIALAVGALDSDTRPDVLIANATSNTLVSWRGTPYGWGWPGETYEAARRPVALALADLDGKGGLDVVAANEVAGTVSLWLNRPRYLLGPRTDFAVASGPRDVAACDVNGDRMPDLAVACASGVLTLLFGSADVTFKARTDLQCGIRPSGITCADFDADGRQDLAVSDAVADGVWVLLNEGRGFRAPVRYPTGGGPNGVVAGDLNGDSRPDLVVLNGAWGSLSILLNQGGRPQGELPAGPRLAVVGGRARGGDVELRYVLERPAQAVWIDVVDGRGRIVRRLGGGPQCAGEHAVSWDRFDAGSARAARGVYWIRLRADAEHAARRMVLVHD